ncbi:MAG: hypothetical protein ACJ8J7_06910 [Sulfurifustaceae bacterium]
MNKLSLRLLLMTLSLLAAAPALVAGADKKDDVKGIKKCRDAAGKWHYGDDADEACAQSQVTVMSNQGLAKKEIAAPLTAEQLKQREQQETDSQRAQERVRQDQLLLSTYANEEDITYIRDRKIAQIDSVIRASTDTLNPLRKTLARLEAQADAEQKAGAVSNQTTKALEQTRRQIAKHEGVIAQKEEEKQQLRTRADQELTRYRALKAQAAQAPTTASKH